MASLFDRVKVATSTTGTGTITLGAAVRSSTVGDFLTFAEAGVADGGTVSYFIVDGASWAKGRGTYTASGTTLARDASEIRWNGSALSTAALSLSGSAVVYISARAADIAPYHNFTNALALSNETIGHGSDPAYNTFLGSLAGSLVSTGSGGTSEGARNVAIGFKAQSSNTTGWQNTNIGFISGQKNTAGVYNTGVGAYSLTENTTGNVNTAIGADALWLNTTGNNNTGIGGYALQQNTTGSNNTSVGKDALRENITGSYNVAVGASSLANNTTGDYNAVFGRNAMRLNTTGSNNVAVGDSALYSNRTHNENVALGGYALVTSNGGYRNIAIGFSGLEALTAGFQNVSIGYQSGVVLTDGDNNVFIGNTAGNATTTGNRNILIGHGVNASSASADDEINIGNVIKGNRATNLTSLLGLKVQGPGSGSFAGYPATSNIVQPDDATCWAQRYGNAVAGDDYGLIYYVSDGGDVVFSVGRAAADYRDFMKVFADGGLLIASPNAGTTEFAVGIKFGDGSEQTTAALSGIYTPTLTNAANLAASTAYACQWSRAGNVVTVSGKVDVDPTAPATSTQLGISLPVASNLANDYECAGVAFAIAVAGQGAGILGDATNNRAQMEWVSGDIANRTMAFTFSYQVI